MPAFIDFVLADLQANLGPRLAEAFRISPSSLVVVCVCTSVIYLFLVFFMQFSRRPFVGQSSMVDLVLMLVIANGVQNAMVVGDNTLAGGIVASLTLFAWDGTLGWLRRRYPRTRPYLGGERIKILEEGRPLDEKLARERLARADLEEVLRRNGLTTFAQVCDAYLEVDGSITLTPYPDTPARRSSQVHHPRRKR